MNEICPRCGLPKPICVCESIAKESQRIKVYLENKKFGKTSTVVDGLNHKEIDIKEIAKKLKSELACGGTIKDGKIELQGDHKGKVKRQLISMGFAPETIDI
ncbi:stress response translation initiation inhibitor YciH [Candidatus Woesearchaeota archaeon]|nr:stress response translation initiation inhibitor YciH [Candidatus Woesearchaeota archaeon]